MLRKSILVALFLCHSSFGFAISELFEPYQDAYTYTDSYYDEPVNQTTIADEVAYKAHSYIKSLSRQTDRMSKLYQRMEYMPYVAGGSAVLGIILPKPAWIAKAALGVVSVVGLLDLAVFHISNKQKGLLELTFSIPRAHAATLTDYFKSSPKGFEDFLTLDSESAVSYMSLDDELRELTVSLAQSLSELE